MGQGSVRYVTTLICKLKPNGHFCKDDATLYETVLDHVNLPLHKKREKCDDMIKKNVKDRPILDE